jgi:hypothetical protein
LINQVFVAGVLAEGCADLSCLPCAVVVVCSIATKRQTKAGARTQHALNFRIRFAFRC